MGKKGKGILPGAAMITVTIFRSVVDDAKETKRLENPVKIKDVFPGEDLSNSIISVNGFLQDGEYELVDGDICAIRLFPEGNGADWVAGTGMGLLLGLSVLNFWNPAGWLGIASWAGAAIVMGGATVAGALGFGIASAAGKSFTSWLTPDAQVGKSPESVEGIPQLRGAKNQSNYGKPVPLVLGKHLFTPMYVGNPYSTIGGTDGEDQYFQALYMLGYGRLKVTDVKLGIIGDLASGVAPDNSAMEPINRISTNNGTWTVDRDGFVKCSGRKNSQFNFAVQFRVNNKIVSYGKEQDVLSVKVGDIVEILADRDISCYFIPPCYVEDGELFFDGDSFLSKSRPQIELIQSERESELYPQAVREEMLNIELLHPKDDSALKVVRFSAKNPQKIQVEITMPCGLLKYDKNGDKEDTSVSISVRWRVSRPKNEENWKEFAQFGSGNQEKILYSSPITTITRSKTKVMRFIAEKTFTSYSQVSDEYDTRVIEIEVYRSDEQSDDNKIMDKVHLTAIRTWLFDNEKSKEPGTLVAQAPVMDKLRNKTARLGLRIKATQNTQGMLDALNCIVESKCRTWNKVTKKWSDADWDIKNQRWIGNSETPSNNPAAVALKLLQSPALGRKAYADESEMIDMESFGEFYEWCESREYIKNGVIITDDQKYTCNGVLTSEKRVDDVLALILSTGRASRILNGSKYGLLIDKKRDYPVMILNSQNVLEATNQKGFVDLPDGFLVRFVNENDGYQQTEEYVMANGESPESQPEAVIENLELPYITNREQAVKYAWYLLACRHLRPEIWNRKVSVDGYLIGMGDLVEVQDDTIVVGIGEGAIIKGLTIENNVITEIQTDGEFDVVNTTNKMYGIKIMQFDGENPGKVRTIQVPIPEPGIYSDFAVSIPLNTTPPIPHEGDVISFGIFDRITTPAICFGKKDNGDGTFDITLIPYQEGIYTTDGGKIPPYEANITTPQGPVQPPVVPDYVENMNDRISEAQKEASIKQYTDYRYAKNNSSEQRPPFSADTDSPGANWFDAPPAAGEGEYIWMTAALWRGDQRLDAWSAPMLLSGRTGQNAVYLDLDNENHSIACDSEGNPAAGALGFTVQASVYDGTMAVNPADVTFFAAPDNINVSISNDGVISVPANAVLQDTTLITVLALYKGMALYQTLTLVKVYAGSAGLDGADAVVYAIQPSVNVVRKNQHGVLDPVNVTCQQFVHVGNQMTPSNERLEYQLSTMAYPALYTGPVSIGSAVWIDFILYHGSGMILDRERVPVVQDGQDALGIDSIPRDPWGYWPLDRIDGNIIPDASGNGRDMLLKTAGNTVTLDNGKFGNAVRLDGTTGAAIETQYPNVTFYPSGDFTVSAWAYYDADSVSASAYILGNADTGGFYLQINSAGKFAFGVYSNGAYRAATDTTAAPLKTWHHVVGKYNSAEKIITLKVNNVIKATLVMAQTITWPTNKVPLAIGHNPSSPQFATVTEVWKGLIDEAAVFEYLTTDDQDEALYYGWMQSISRDGNGISTIMRKYRLTSTNTMPPEEWADSGWLETMPTPTAENRYLWQIERIQFTGAPEKITKSLLTIHGKKGDDGVMRFLQISCSALNMANGSHDDRGVYIPAFIAAAQKKIEGDSVSAQSAYWRVEETEDGTNWYDLVNDATARSSLDIEPGRVSSMQAGKSTRGWAAMEGSFFFDPDVNYFVRKFTESSPNISLYSNWFDIGDNEIWTYEFTWNCKVPRQSSNSPGVHARVTRETNNYCQTSNYNVATGNWNAWGADNTEVYHYDHFNTVGALKCITYICGRNVPVEKLPRPATQLNGTQQNVRAVRMSPNYPVSRFMVRAVTNNSLIAGTAFDFRLCKPMLYRNNPPVAIRIRTYSDSAKTQLIADTVIPVAFDGELKFTETRFCRSNAKPATPNGELPANWHTSPPNEPVHLWQSTVSKDGYGRQVGDWSEPVRITGEDGKDLVFLDIDNEFISLAADAAGALNNHTAIYSQARLYKGASEITSAAAWLISPTVSDVSIHPTSGLITIAAGYMTQTTDRQEVNVNAAYNNNNYHAVLTIAKVKAGADGSPAVIYELLPNVSAVKRNAAGTPDPGNISCTVLKITGNATPVADTTKTIKYITNLNSNNTENAYNTHGANITIEAAWTFVEFRLYSGSTLIDKERVPIVQDGQNGLGIDQIPGDAYLHLSCDDLLQIPDNPAGTKYRNDAAWTGWNNFTSSGGTVTKANGILKITGSAYVSRTAINVDEGDIIVLRARWTGSNAPRYLYLNTAGGNAQPLLRLGREWSWIISQISDSSRPFNGIYAANRNVDDGWEASDIYIGDASYLTPIIDNSGNGRHMTITKGVVPVPGKFGNGLKFFGSGAAYTKEVFYPTGDFTWALWVYKDGAASTDNQYLIANVETGGGGLRVLPSGAIELMCYSDGTYRYAGIPVSRAPNNTWLHLILKYDSALKKFTIKINNVLDSATLTLPDQISWPASIYGVPLALGGNPDPFNANGVPTFTANSYFFGMLDEVAVFTRLTTDREDDALYKTALMQKYTDADWQVDQNNPNSVRTPRYLGAAYTPVNSGVIVITVSANFTKTVQAYHGDWVAYLGTNTPAGFPLWVNGMCMRWNGCSWEQIPINASGLFESKPYMDAMVDLTKDAPAGTFMSILANNLIAAQASIDALTAKTAFIEKLFSKEMILNGDGIFKTEGFAGVNGNVPGARITAATGLLEAFGAILKNLTVVNGDFTGIDADAIQITGASSFSGNIDTGVLKVLPSSTTSFSLTNPANASAINTFMANARSTLGYPSNIAQFTVFPTYGAYYFKSSGGYVQETIKSITFTFSGGPGYNPIILTSVNGKTTTIDTSNPGTNPPYTLTFSVGTTTRTVRLHGLPTSTNVQYELYKKYDSNSGEYYLMIKG